MITAEQLVKTLDRQHKAGKSLREIGEKLSVSPQAVHQWLNGTTKPSNLVLKIAEQGLSDG